jgi:hypothetical protein
VFTRTEVPGREKAPLSPTGQAGQEQGGHSLYCCSFSVYSESEPCRCFLGEQVEA